MKKKSMKYEDTHNIIIYIFFHALLQNKTKPKQKTKTKKHHNN